VFHDLNSLLARAKLSECGPSVDGSPLLLAATGRGEVAPGLSPARANLKPSATILTADESAVEKAGPSSRIPKVR